VSSACENGARGGYIGRLAERIRKGNGEVWDGKREEGGSLEDMYLDSESRRIIYGAGPVIWDYGWSHPDTSLSH
jgi:hypothetical protein